MKEIPDVPYPEVFERNCHSHEHWFDVLAYGRCDWCGKGLAHAPKRTAIAKVSDAPKYYDL